MGPWSYMTSLTELLYQLLLVTLTPYLAVIFVVKILPKGNSLDTLLRIYSGLCLKKPAPLESCQFFKTEHEPDLDSESRHYQG